jgi:hypothetical protein
MIWRAGVNGVLSFFAADLVADCAGCFARGLAGGLALAAAAVSDVARQSPAVDGFDMLHKDPFLSL